MSAIREHFKERPRRALCSALELIQVLHPRRKDNEPVKIDLRPVTDEDAALCVHAVGFLIHKAGWARLIFVPLQSEPASKSAIAYQTV